MKYSVATMQGPMPSFLISRTGRRVSVVLVSSAQERHAVLRQVAKALGWELTQCTTCRAGLERLKQNHPPVVVCDEQLSDGDWKTVMEAVHKLEVRPNVVVVSASPGDSLWAETLNWGAYDLLISPYNAGEAYRLITLAWEAKQRQMAPPAPKKPVAAPYETAAAARVATQRV